MGAKKKWFIRVLLIPVALSGVCLALLSSFAQAQEQERPVVVEHGEAHLILINTDTGEVKQAQTNIPGRSDCCPDDEVVHTRGVVVRDFEWSPAFAHHQFCTKGAGPVVFASVIYDRIFTSPDRDGPHPSAYGIGSIVKRE